MSHVIKEVAGVLGFTLKHATTKHAQTIGLLERSHASIKQTLKIETGERRSLWHKNVNIAVLYFNISYHTSVGCEPIRVFQGRIPYNVLDLKLGIRPQQQSIPKLPKMFLTKQKRSIKMFARMPCKRTSNTRLITTKRRTLQNSKKQIMYMSNIRKRIIKAVKFHLQNFGGLARTLLEKYYQIRIIFGANKTQVLHRMRMRQFTPRESPADIRVKAQEYKPDPEVSFNHDNLYARAWEYDYEQPIFDAENNDAAPPDSQEIPVQSAFSTEELRNTPGTTHE